MIVSKREYSEMPKAQCFVIIFRFARAEVERKGHAPSPISTPYIFSETRSVVSNFATDFSCFQRERERAQSFFLDSSSNKSAVSFSVSSLPQTQSQPSISISISISLVCSRLQFCARYLFLYSSLFDFGSSANFCWSVSISSFLFFF